MYNTDTVKIFGMFKRKGGKMSIKKQAEKMGHMVVGALKRVADDVFTKRGVEIRFRQYVDAEGTLYAVNCTGKLEYIAGDDWVI